MYVCTEKDEYTMSPDLYWMLQQEAHPEQIDNYKLPSEIAMNWYAYCTLYDEPAFLEATGFISN